LDTPTRRPIRVSLDATASVLATRSVPRVSDRDLARALSRVLAHEIGHVLLGAPYHDQAGLMRAVFLPEELADPDRRPFRLTCNGIARLGSRLRALTKDERFIHDDHTVDQTSCDGRPCGDVVDGLGAERPHTARNERPSASFAERHVSGLASNAAA
jgi:hypothetical protein